MHVSSAFGFDSALAALVGGLGIGLVATIYAHHNHAALPSSTPNANVHLGMLATSAVASALLAPQFFEDGSFAAISLPRLAAAGGLVGLGAQLGHGCTCGNGIQGLASLSPASLAFVLVFMAAGAVAAVLGDQSAALVPTPTTFSPALLAVALALAAGQLALGRRAKAASSAAMVAAANALGGAGFAVSLVQASMVKPSKIDGFLNVAGARGWDPSLAFVMGGALLLALPLWRALRVADASPALRKWAARPVTPSLLAGGVCFGAGWALGGLCPGPAWVSAGTGSVASAVWLGSMVAGRQLAPIVAAALG